MPVTHNGLLTYCESNTGWELLDLFKYLYQSCLGCEHLVTDPDRALAWISQESKDADLDDLPAVELLDGDEQGEYCRVHLRILQEGLSPRTLCRLFLLSAEKSLVGCASLTEKSFAECASSTETSAPECVPSPGNGLSKCASLTEMDSPVADSPAGDGLHRLVRALDDLICLAQNGKLPFSADELSQAIDQWRSEGYPAVHHSERFRSSHHPAYRVLRRDFLRLLPLLIRIDTLLSSDRPTITVALDGRCASGKTTLASLLERIYDCRVWHMDDYFLRPSQRTAARRAQPGENVDHERFYEEVLLPLSKGHPVTYQRFDCAAQTLTGPFTVSPCRLNIVEGSYCLHPQLRDLYDLSVFLDLTPDRQRERILRRNGAAGAERFFSTWIPLEERYFSAMDIRNVADLIISPTTTHPR